MIEETSGTDIDLSRLRALAEEGRARPLLGGRQLVAFGGAIILAAAVQWAIETRLLPWPPATLALSWFGLMAAAAVAVRLWHPAQRITATMSLANQVERQVWLAGGMFLAVVPIAIIAISSWRVANGMGGQGFAMFTVMPAVTFGVYAVALAASATAGAVAWLHRFSWASVAFAGLSLLTAQTHWQMPVLMVGALVVSVLPGLRLEKIAQGQNHG